MMVRYRSLIQDSARWNGFELRSSDIVISAPAKCGTTWTQMLCALLVFGGPDFPMPLNQISPWLDQTTRSIDEVRALYGAQDHRRFIKTHTPLDGIPLHDGVTYVVVGRDPRDAMISMEHHLANMDLDRVVALRGLAVGNDDLDTLPARPPVSDDPAERFRSFVTLTEHTGPPNLTGVLHHLDTAWQRRHCGNLVMCHFADFAADLSAETLRLASALGFELTEARAAELASEATLDRMRGRANDVAPNAHEIWRDHRAFFRSGSFGEWRARVTADDLAMYDRVVATIVPPELASWAHNGRVGSGIEPAVV
jgi:Sulfotransferase domain